MLSQQTVSNFMGRGGASDFNKDYNEDFDDEMQEAIRMSL